MAFEATADPVPGVRSVMRSDVLIVGALLAVAIVSHCATSLPYDVAWLTTVCERLIAGQELYRDIYELNPPMSAWLYLPAVRLAQLLGLAPETMVVLELVGFGWLMIAATERILVGAGLIESRLAFRIVSIAALLIAPVETFAQREHFAVLAALPMIAAAAARASSRPAGLGLRLIGGVGAGLAMSIKPHFAAAIALPLIYAAMRNRALSSLFAVENFVAAAVVAIYAGAILVLCPAYVSEMLPWAREVYLPTRVSLPDLLTAPAMQQIYAVFGILIATRRALFATPLFATLGLATAGFVLSYLVQGKGWGYHLLPAYGLALVTLGMSIVTSGAGANRFNRALAALFVAVLAIGPALEYPRWRTANAALENVLRPLGPNLKLALMSDLLQVASPLHRDIGATFVNRGPSLWIAGSAFDRCRGRDDPALAELCRRASARERGMFLQDVTRQPPDVILTDSDHHDWQAWAREDPTLSGILDGYRAIATVRSFGSDVTVLQRRTAER